MCERFYLIECLKRSSLERKVWWREDRAGYTHLKNEAGRYSAEEIVQCAGNFGDWVAHPEWRKCPARLRGEWECGE